MSEAKHLTLHHLSHILQSTMFDKKMFTFTKVAYLHNDKFVTLLHMFKSNKNSISIESIQYYCPKLCLKFLNETKCFGNILLIKMIVCCFIGMFGFITYTGFILLVKKLNFATKPFFKSNI